MNAQSTEAARLAKAALRTLSHRIMEQITVVDSFLEEDLLLDRSTLMFHSPLFVSLNNELHTHSRTTYTPQILQMLGRLREIHTMTVNLQHYCDDIEIEVSHINGSFHLLLSLMNYSKRESQRQSMTLRRSKPVGGLLG